MKQQTISKIVRASGVLAGEQILVHFWGEDTDKAIAGGFLRAVVELGASPLLLQQSRSLNRQLFLGAKESCFDEHYFALFDTFDAVLDVFACQPITLGAPLPDGPMALYRRYLSRLFDRLTACKRFAQIRVPTQANAAESGLDPQEYIRRMELAYDIDYDALRAACTRKAAAFAGAQRVALYTGEGCVAYFDLRGRDWHIDAGDGDLPCGEVYIAPNENKTEGDIFFDVLCLEEKQYTDVTLQIAHGEVVGSSDPAAAAAFAAFFRQNRTVCELGLGMNPQVTSLCSYTLLDEKMAGTFHIAVGANAMFGGQNRADWHMDFVGHGRVERVE